MEGTYKSPSVAIGPQQMRRVTIRPQGWFKTRKVFLHSLGGREIPVFLTGLFIGAQSQIAGTFSVELLMPGLPLNLDLCHPGMDIVLDFENRSETTTTSIIVTLEGDEADGGGHLVSLP